jgi:hypothetical protein
MKTIKKILITIGCILALPIIVVLGYLVIGLLTFIAPAIAGVYILLLFFCCICVWLSQKDE